jgi:prepilin-type N-terminal cleavage/methylation domain-containing protein
MLQQIRKGAEMSKQLNKKGFTLIEVVLVLAIGGLIFLLAFLAFQQVSRNRRDTQRRSDVARMSASWSDQKADNPTATTATIYAAWQTSITAATGIPNLTDPTTNARYVQDQTAGTRAVGDFWVNDTTTPTQVCVRLEGGTDACRNFE